MPRSARRPVSSDDLEQLYRQRFGAFLRVATALCGDRELARDAVQEAFARAFRARRSFRGEGSLEAWLWSILLNVCRTEHRRARPLPVGEEPTANGSADEHGELRAALAALPERQRLVVFLRHYADLDYETIARAAGVRRGTVAASLHAAHAALRRALEKEVRR